MRSHVRVSLVALVVSASVAFVAAPAAQAASSFGVESVFAANCKVATCGKFEIPSLKPEEVNPVELYTQAAGHPLVGVTQFKVNTEGTFPNAAPSGIATGEIVTHVRTDVGRGVSTNPEAVEKCSFAEFDNVEPTPGFFLEPNCKAASEIGVNQVIVYLGPEPSPKGGDLPVEGKVYNLVQPEGRASDFGVALKLPLPLTEQLFKGTPLEKVQLYAHTLIEGGIEWGEETKGKKKGDYHDYYEINVSPTLPLISSRLNLFGNIGTTGHGGFITNPSSCTGTGPQTTTTVSLMSKGGVTERGEYDGPLGTEGCKGESPFSAVPFEPKFSLASGPEESQSDLPDGITTNLSLPHDPSPTGIDTSQLENAVVTLPEGMTLNPSAARGLEACTPAQARIHGETFGVTCPSASKIGTVALEVPTLPAGSLTGNIYLGGPESGKIRGGTEAKPEYTIYVNAESARYGVDVRLEGTVTPNPTTGQVTATFVKNPEQPFSSISLKFNGGALAPIANPLACGAATAATSLTPYTGTAAQSPGGSFVVDSNGKGGACAASTPFSLSQSTVNQPPGNAGAKTSYTLNLERADGQQYLSQIKTVLPAGLVGLIPSVPLCGEPQASKGECSPASQIGVVGVEAGSGPSPYAFSGQVYLTGPYGGAPFGLTIETSAIAGPFDLGSGPCDCVLSRGTIEVDPFTARVTATTQPADDRQRRAVAVEESDRQHEPAGLPHQPDQLRRAGDRNDVDVDARREADPVQPVPGRQLQSARVQAQVRVGDQREDVESQRREPGNDDQHAGGRREHQIGARAAA